MFRIITFLGLMAVSAQSFGQVPQLWKQKTGSPTIIVPAGATDYAVEIPSTQLRLKSSGSSNSLTFGTSEALTGDRALTWSMGDAARTITLSGSPTLNDWFNQSVKSTASPTFGGAMLSGATPFLQFTSTGSVNWYLQGGVSPTGASSGNYLTTLLPAGKGMAVAQSGSGTLFLMDTGGNVSFGTGSVTPLAKCESRTTSGPQFIASYDASNYYSTTVSSAGAVTFDAVGSGAAFSFADNISVTNTAGDCIVAATGGTPLTTAGDGYLNLASSRTDTGVGHIVKLRSVAPSAGKADLAFLTQPSNGVYTERMRIDNAGNVGIGMTPTYLVDILSPTLTDFGTKWFMRARGPTNITTSAANYILAFDMDLSNMSVSAGVTDSGYRMGVRGDAYAGAVGFAGTLATQYGVLGRAGISSATAGAVVTNAEGLHGEVLNSVAGTTITNGYGLRVVNTGTTGTMTNRWGVYVDTATGGKNYFSHAVGVGSTTVSAQIHATSTTEQLRLGYDSSNYLSTTVSSSGAATLATTGTNASITLTPSGTGNVILSKIPRFNGTNSTGAGSSLLGANSPATTLTAPYTWISIITSDGSTAYVPAWK